MYCIVTLIALSLQSQLSSYYTCRKYPQHAHPAAEATEGYWSLQLQSHYTQSAGPITIEQFLYYHLICDSS